MKDRANEFVTEGMTRMYVLSLKGPLLIRSIIVQQTKCSSLSLLKNIRDMRR
jgi:hypothetical protein